MPRIGLNRQRTDNGTLLEYDIYQVLLVERATKLCIKASRSEMMGILTFDITNRLIELRIKLDLHNVARTFKQYRLQNVFGFGTQDLLEIQISAQINFQASSYINFLKNSVKDCNLEYNIRYIYLKLCSKNYTLIHFSWLLQICDNYGEHLKATTRVDGVRQHYIILYGSQQRSYVTLFFLLGWSINTYLNEGCNYHHYY